MNDLDQAYLAIDAYDDWMALGRASYLRCADLLAAATASDWEAPTACTGWTVRDLAGHLVGAMRSAASLRETASQQRAVAKRVKETGEAEVDALTALQIARAADLEPPEVVAELRRLVDPAIAGRQRLPRFVRRRVGFQVHLGAIDERWTLDRFLGQILTRDAWLHGVDLADALGVDLALDATDRAVVGDVAVEWAHRHGRPVDLSLTGPAGGRLVVGQGGDRLEVDAVEFCRIVSGRSSGDHPLLDQPVPF
ncbi:MAG: maleylpyruvate isomerase family mycothiol-dependent enzyme [Acidimicrobiales bacterium]|nr:maleylpyruvate isomerase family mycothiol-dependent enzyme [Acidimicrobiales bacterium]